MLQIAYQSLFLVIDGEKMFKKLFQISSSLFFLVPFEIVKEIHKMGIWTQNDYISLS